MFRYAGESDNHIVRVFYQHSLLCKHLSDLNLDSRFAVGFIFKLENKPMIRFNVIQPESNYGSIEELLKSTLKEANYRVADSGTSRVVSVRGDFNAFLSKIRNVHNKGLDGSIKLSHTALLKSMVAKTDQFPIVQTNINSLATRVCRTIGYTGFPSNDDAESILATLAVDYIEQNPQLSLDDFLSEVLEETVTRSAVN